MEVYATAKLELIDMDEDVITSSSKPDRKVVLCDTDDESPYTTVWYDDDTYEVFFDWPTCLCQPELCS